VSGAKDAGQVLLPAASSVLAASWCGFRLSATSGGM
jgi:hypothetical protein